MMLGILLANRTTTLLLVSRENAVLTTRDASWRVGSGTSLASHVAELLHDQPLSIGAIRRLALIDQGGSYTSARTAYAFVQGLGFATG